jgi:DNA replication factor Dna2
MQDVLSAAGEALAEVGLTEAAAANDMRQHLPNVAAWLHRYVVPQKTTQQQQQQQNVWQQQAAWQQGQQQGQQQQGHYCQPGGTVDAGPNSGGSAAPRVAVLGVADIEENVWAPRCAVRITCHCCIRWFDSGGWQ